MVWLSALTSSERQRFRPRVDQTTAHIPSQASPAEADCLRHERRRTRGDSKTTTLYQNRLRRINVREGFFNANKQRSDIYDWRNRKFQKLKLCSQIINPNLQLGIISKERGRWATWSMATLRLSFAQKIQQTFDLHCWLSTNTFFL